MNSKGGISKPNPFNLHAGYVDIPGYDILLNNNKFINGLAVGGGIRSLIGKDASDIVQIGSTINDGGLTLNCGAAYNFVFSDGTVRLTVNSSNIVQIGAGLATPTNLQRGLQFAKGVNATAAPAAGAAIWADATDGHLIIKDENDPAAGVPRACRIKTGTYTGDGNTSQAITGVGFRPKFLQVWTHVTGAVPKSYIMTDQGGALSIADQGDGWYMASGYIDSLDADGFTAGDGDTQHPNYNSVVYDYLAMG